MTKTKIRALKRKWQKIEDELYTLQVKYREAEKRYLDLELEYADRLQEYTEEKWQVKNGAVVIGTGCRPGKGKECLVHSVIVLGEIGDKPWVKAFPKNKDGSWSKFPVHLYQAWELRDETTPGQ